MEGDEHNKGATPTATVADFAAAVEWILQQQQQQQLVSLIDAVPCEARYARVEILYAVHMFPVTRVAKPRVASVLLRLMQLIQLINRFQHRTLNTPKKHCWS
jgi:hypothetical protein